MRFSVIIPLYNKGRLISDAIHSVLAQTVSDFEVFVVDDGSTDDGYAVAAAISDPRITVLRQENRGVSVARNNGIESSTGEYLCFLDADDFWLPNHLEALGDLIERFPGAGMYATRYRTIESDGTETVIPMETEYLLLEDLFALELKTGLTYLHTNSVCLPRRILDQIGLFVIGEKRAQDVSLWMRAAAYFDVALTKSITTVYRREYSDAYIGVSLREDWSFLRFADNLVTDERIPQAKRSSIVSYVNRYRVSLCRHALLAGERKKARTLYRNVDWILAGKKEKWITDVCFLIPSSLLRSVYHRRYHGSFRD